MLVCDVRDSWTQFLQFAKARCSATAFDNWFAPVRVLEAMNEEIVLEVPNIFVQEYILSNFKEDLRAFLPVNALGEPAIRFVIAPPQKKLAPLVVAAPKKSENSREGLHVEAKLNAHYRFENFIEGSANQFVKSAAMGAAQRPGQSYNPLFIHGGVGLGKTHLLHSIGHHIRENHKKLRIQCITTEAFINELVDSLRNKSVDKMKRFYRSEIDVLLVDDIQFLQNRLNFEEELSHMFEALKHKGAQVVITSDKPPSLLKLSERMIGKMEGGLVAHMGVPELETRVAIIQHKAEQKGLQIPPNVAFFIAENISHNVRQLEGALNRLSAHCRLLHLPVTEDLVKHALREMFIREPQEKVSVEQIFKAVATVFQVRQNDLKGTCRTQDIALARQVAMFIAKEMISDSLTALGAAFGKTHSTILHACKNIEKKLTDDDTLRRQLDMVRRSLKGY